MCQEALPFSESPQWWVYECGHIRCSAHADTLCCGQANYLCNILDDEAFYATCTYMRYLHPRSQDLGECYSAAYTSLMQLLMKLIEVKTRVVQRPSQWTCPQCRSILPCSQATCPTCPSANIFKSLTTLTMSPEMKSLPWVCPKPTCGSLCAAAATTCVCGYVNLQRVELQPVAEELQVVKEAAEEQEQGSSQIWACPSCKYEYNFKEDNKCQKCKFQRNPNNCGLM